MRALAYTDKETRVLVVGAKGQLGTAIRDAEKTNEGIRWFYTDIEDGPGITDVLDATNYVDVEYFVINHKITHIINCAAYTNVARAEDDYDMCDRLNVIIPVTLGDVCRNLGVTLIHISSDYVYSGLNKTTPYKEFETCHPKWKEPDTPEEDGKLVDDYITYIKGNYGKSKFQGERVIEDRVFKHFILRTSWLYYEGFDTSFPMKIIDRLVKTGYASVVIDQTGTPTYAGDLADAIVMLIEDNRTEYGVYNFSNMGVASWYDFAKEIESWLADSLYNIRVDACTGEDNIRPYYSVMDKSKFVRTFNYDIPYWRDSLTRFLFKLLSHRNDII